MPPLSTQALERVWDVVIIGAGMGGGVTARALADAGLEVLLVDRGNDALSASGPGAATDDFNLRLSEGKWPTINTFEVDGKVSRLFGPYGAGVGGSTNLYAAALERFERHDLDPLPEMPHPTGGWAFSYNELLPYYERAEHMLHIAGTQDPLDDQAVTHLRQPPALGPADTDLFKLFAKSGLHPYRLHVGIRYRPGCDECLGRLCQNDCRADARSVLAEGRLKATILERTEVLRLEASSDSVSHAVVRQGDGEFTVSGKVFVLAAGALHTPKLLLQSCGEHWPDGLANRSGMVGRNLMFHAMQRFAIWPSRRLPDSGPRKSIGFRDFYRVRGERFGSVQSTGFKAGYGDVLVHFYNVFDRSMVSGLRLLRPLLRIPAAIAVRLFGYATIFVGHVEDLPYPENRVVLDPDEADGISMKYTVPEELRDRVDRFRGLIKKQLREHRTFFLSPGVELNYGHACGTCAMGDDPATSVVDLNCQAHGITNLFIADGSFMPTSAATNPALTIAANALRVADAIRRVLLPGSEAEVDSAQDRCSIAIQ